MCTRSSARRCGSPTFVTIRRTCGSLAIAVSRGSKLRARLNRVNSISALSRPRLPQCLSAASRWSSAATLSPLAEAINARMRNNRARTAGQGSRFRQLSATRAAVACPPVSKHSSASYASYKSGSAMRVCRSWPTSRSKARPKRPCSIGLSRSVKGGDTPTLSVNRGWPIVRVHVRIGRRRRLPRSGHPQQVCRRDPVPGGR